MFRLMSIIAVYLVKIRRYLLLRRILVLNASFSLQGCLVSTCIFQRNDLCTFVLPCSNQARGNCWEYISLDKLT